jgi:hypothetical protein
MLGQVEEFKEVRAKIATIQTIENASPAVKQQTDKEVKEFLDKPEVKEDYKKFKAAQKKVQQTTQKMAELEEEHPELTADSTKLFALRASLQTKPTDMASLAEYMTARQEQTTAMRTSLMYLSSLRERAETYGTSHTWFSRVKYAVLEGIGHAAMAGALVGAATAGGVPAVAITAGSMWATGEALATVIENGTESLIEYAASQGTTQTEAERFARTALWVVEGAVATTAAVGAFKIIKGGSAITSKVQGWRTNISSMAKNAFQRKQSSQVKIDTTSLEGIAKAIEQSQTVQIQKARPLLPGEGKVGTFKDTKRLNEKGSNLAAHHIPNADYMQAKGVSRTDGISMNVEHPNPGVGGRHREIHKELQKIDPELAPRDALAKSIMRAREIYREDGVYTQELKESLLDVIKQNKETFPNLFKK